ncbi:putative GPI-anchored cupredoxin [Colletotrichum sp. SAR 10_86]|nr:putative GPI-anchored cupredoxin [Colletotrichum sp. SAR 10_86]
MVSSHILGIAAFAVLAGAQSTTSTDPITPTPFYKWIFYPDGHSVIRSEFGYPCTPYEYIDVGRQGFYSGPEPVKAITNDMPRFRVRVNDTDPIFFYCGAPGSCYKEKMIGVINENSTQTLDKQLEAALPLTTQILPGEPFPTESDASRNDHHHLSGGAIAGIVIGCAAFLIFGGLLIYLCGRRGGLKRAYRQPPQSGQAGEVEASHPPVTEVNYSAQPKSPATQGWRNSHYSELSGTYRDQPTPIGGFPGASPPMSPQPHSMQAYYDPRISSIAPSIAVEAPDNQAAAPPPAAAPEAAPVELPASADPGNSPLPAYKPRFSFAGQEADYRPSKEQS